MGLSGYTLHLTNRTAHSGPHGQTGAVYAGGAPGLILLSKTAEVFCWVLQRKKRKYDSFPACLDAAIPFHEQTAFWHRHYSCTAPRAVETPLTDVRTFYLYGRRMREREKQRAFWTSTHALCVDIPRRRAVPQERAAPLLVSALHWRASRFAIAASKCRREALGAFTRPAVQTVLPALDAAPLRCPAL